MKGLNKSETHFSVTVVSDQFASLGMVKRHQRVYQLLDQELKEGLHALQLNTKTPEEYTKLDA
jgi:BolA-like protein 1